MPVRPHASAQPEHESEAILAHGKEKQDDQRCIESFCGEKDGNRELRPEERAADSLVEDIFQTDGKQKDGKQKFEIECSHKTEEE